MYLILVSEKGICRVGDGDGGVGGRVPEVGTGPFTSLQGVGLLIQHIWLELGYRFLEAPMEYKHVISLCWNRERCEGPFCSPTVSNVEVLPKRGLLLMYFMSDDIPR